MENENLSEHFVKFLSRYMKKVYLGEVFWNINSLCFCLKYLGNLKSESNVLTVFSDKFLKPFRQKHLLENYLSQIFLFKCIMKKYIVKKYQYIN